MSQSHFDSLDYKILKLLAQNARKPYLEIARECGVSGAAIHQRIQKLQAQKVLLGFESLISPDALGYDTCAYVGMFLNDPSQFDTVAAELRKIPEVVELHYTTGKYDILAKLYAHNNKHLLQIIHDRLQSVTGVRTETLISFKEEFRRPIPITESDSTLNKLRNHDN